MTNERAVEILNLDLDILGQYGGETAEAYKMAIQALEAQPSEDCVSRSELQKTMDSLPLFRFVNNDHEEADDYYNCESVDMVIRNLPSVTPERPKGKWIEIEIDAGEFIYKCTKCGMRVINPYKYCPNCGAEMSGGAEE